MVGIISISGTAPETLLHDNQQKHEHTHTSKVRKIPGAISGVMVSTSSLQKSRDSAQFTPLLNKDTSCNLHVMKASELVIDGMTA